MSAETVFSFKQAIANLRKKPASRWPEIVDDFATGVLPIVHPSFQLSPGEEIFTIGSCFARNIEAHLALLGCRIPMLAFSLPPEEWFGLPNQALNKFTPPTFLQALQWTAAIRRRDGKVRWDDCESIAFPCTGGTFFDLDLTTQTPVSRERFLERRQHIYNVMSAAFSASCLIMTPGLIEGWRDRETGLFVSGAGLKHKEVLAAGDRFELVVLDYHRCFNDLAASIDLVRSHNPECKILITTSPVPLAATFSGQDVRIANTYSKSVLRAVCGALSQARPMVDYFPSYESVTLTRSDEVWRPDHIHVTDAFVGRIVSRLAETYMTSADPVLLSRQRAATALAAGDFETAEREAMAVLAADPKDCDVRLILADVMSARADFQAVEEAIAALPAQVQALASTQLRLAKAVFATDRQRGVAMGLEICALPDADHWTFLWTERALIATGAVLEERERLLRAGSIRFPQQAAIHVALARVLEESGRIAEAVTELRTATALPITKKAERRAVSDYLAKLAAASE